jgi:WD40 repeat protein
MKRLRVYLSSTFEDLKDHRAAVFAGLERAGLDVARMEAYTASDERPVEYCLRDVGESDVYVGLFAWRYGYEPPHAHGNPQGKSITELEYRHAESRHLRKLLFFADPDTRDQWPERFRDEITDKGDAGAKIGVLRSELGTEKMAGFFRTPEELATLVLAAIMRSGLSGRPFSVPPRPAGLVTRPDLTQSVVAALVAGASGRDVLVHGDGGFGKTTLAMDVCHRAEVVKAFPAGILWATIGEKPDLARALSDLHVAATGSPPAMAGTEAIGTALARVLEERPCLIVVDDVWRPDDLASFLRLDGPRLLVTSRNPTLIEQAGQTGWSDVPVDEMEPDEATAILARGFLLDDATRHMLRVLADRLGRWPLLLELATARLLEEYKTRRGDLAAAIDRVTRVFEHGGVLGFDRHDSHARNAAVARSVQVGLDAAEAILPGLSQKAAELAVFPEDVPVPVRVLADLWGMDEFNAEETVVRRLANTGMLRWDREANTVRLHDMIRRALAVKLAGAAAVHLRLTQAWTDPHRLPHDYAWRWFGWHCIRANARERLLGLLLDVTWLGAKLGATDINALVVEFGHLRDDPRMELLQAACRRSAYVLARDKAQLAGQLLARVPEQEGQLRRQLLATALTGPAVWLRPVTASLAGERSIRWLRPEQGELLWRVTFSHNGRWAANASHQASDVVLWDLEQWRSLGPRFGPGLRSTPYALALSDDGHWYLHGDANGGIHRSGVSPAQKWEGHGHREPTILDIALSADGRRALSACHRGRLVAWDIERGSHEVVWDKSPNVVSMSLDATGESAVVALADGSIELVDLWPTRRRTLFTLTGQPSAVARSGNNAAVAAATSDRIEVRSLDAPGSLIAGFLASEPVTSMALSKDAQYVGVGTAGGTVEVYSVPRRATTARYTRAHAYKVEGVVFSSDAAHVVSADMLQIKEWALEASVSQREGPDELRAMGKVKVTADGLRAVAVLEDGRLGVWNIRTGALESSLPRATGGAFGDPGVAPPDGLALAADAPCVLSWSGTLLCWWDLESGSVASLTVSSTRQAAITPDGTGVVYLDGASVSLWAPGDRRSTVLGSYGHDDPPSDVAISLDGQYALSSGGARKVVMWRLKEPAAEGLSAVDRVRRRQRELGIPWSSEVAAWWIDSRDKPAAVVFAGSGVAIVATGDGSLFLLDTEKHGTGKTWRLDYGDEGSVTHLVVSPDGTHAVSSSRDRPNRVWDLRQRKCVQVLDANPGFIQKFSRALGRALLFTFDGVVKVVSLRDGALLAAFQGDKQIGACDADSELRWIAACDQGGQMHFLHVEGIDQSSPPVDEAAAP